MKIGTCVSLDSMENMEQKFVTLRNNGFDTCQLIAWEPAVWKEENAVV